MKCPECDGTGKVVHPMMSMNGDEYTGEWEQHECEVCGGTGEIEVHMTNEEWRKNCSTEEFAEALTKVVLNIVSWNNDPKPSEVRHILKSWLKQPHTNE